MREGVLITHSYLNIGVQALITPPCSGMREEALITHPCLGMGGEAMHSFGLQTGVGSDQLPLKVHLLTELPISVYPLLHTKAISVPNA